MEILVRSSRIVLALMVMCALALAGCEKSDGDKDVGLALIYIPQATYTGLNNQYPVPGGGGEFSMVNHQVAGNKLNVLLGVTRSGDVSNASGFSVDVAVSAEETTAATSAMENSVAMPSGMYELPSTITVGFGTNSAPFQLSVDIAQLNGSAYDGKKLVLAVKIANPTAYALSTENISVVVVIDVDAMRKAISGS